MRKTITLLALLLLAVSQGTFAQTFTGTVYDKATNHPISGVYVSFNGTVAYTITDNSGKFELTVAQRLITQLVFSHISYNMVIIENPFDEFPKEIYMEPRLNMLDDVTVTARVRAEYTDPFTRQQKLIAFRDQFLGTTRAGKSCIIMNEDDLELRYDVQKNALTVSSDNPIVVFNEYLEYLISFTLVDFRVEYAVPLTLNYDYRPVTNATMKDGIPVANATMRDAIRQRSFDPLSSDNVQRSYYSVMSLFTDLSPDDIRIKRRRDEVYEQSSTFFFKSIANNTLNESNFRIYGSRRRQVVDHSLYFTIEDTFSLKRIQLIPDSGSIINVSYRNRHSRLQFNTDALLVDMYGNIDKFDKVIFTGMMGDARVGDMLPLDYEP